MIIQPWGRPRGHHLRHIGLAQRDLWLRRSQKGGASQGSSAGPGTSRGQASPGLPCSSGPRGWWPTLVKNMKPTRTVDLRCELAWVRKSLAVGGRNVGHRWIIVIDTDPEWTCGKNWLRQAVTIEYCGECRSKCHRTCQRARVEVRQKCRDVGMSGCFFLRGSMSEFMPKQNILRSKKVRIFLSQGSGQRISSCYAVAIHFRKDSYVSPYAWYKWHVQGWCQIAGLLESKLFVGVVGLWLLLLGEVS